MSTKARRKAEIVMSDDEDTVEDTSKQRRKIDAIDQDLDISLVQHDAEQRQERAGYKAAVRLQEQFDKKERQRIASVHEEASSFNIEEWEDIQAIIKADKELALRIQAEEREKYSEAKKARLLSDVDRTTSKIADESSKRAAKEELEQKIYKRQKTGESSEPREKEDDDLTQEDLQQMMMMVPVEEVYVEALQILADMLKKFDRDGLIKLWDLVKERFSTTEPTDDKEKELWVELKRLLEPDNDDTLWKLQKYMHDPLRRRIDAIDQDLDISLVQHDAEVQGRHEQEIEFETKDISTAKTLMYIRRSESKDKAVRLQEQFDKKERQRIARVHEEASSFNIEEWEDIQATIKADKELALRIQAEEREKYSEAKKARLLVDLINQRKRHFAQQRAEERRNKPLTQGSVFTPSIEIDASPSLRKRSATPSSFTPFRKSFLPDESDGLIKLWDLVKERFSTTEPTDDKEKELWVELKRLFEPDNDDTLWKLQKYINDPLVWRLYDTCGVHHVSSVKGHDTFMLVEK
nr:hypothetical protein [Tanacetum cinerariifolium]